MKLIWMSDIHLNFLAEEGRREFYHNINEKSSAEDVILITGDIAESRDVKQKLMEMQQAVSIPIYFVLGNHDFYGSSTTKVKRSVTTLGYLGKKDFVPLGASTALIGVDGWGDCRNGDFEHSHLTMSDWIYIDDLRKGYGKGMPELKTQLQKLADSDAKKLKRKVVNVLKNPEINKIIIATHVPPFEEVCLNAGRKSTPDGLPFYSSQILGNEIVPIAKKYPKVDFLWLSGHTHSRAKFKPCNNMTSKVAKAEYYWPQIEEIINVWSI